jgi:hypothetical protein
VQRVISSGRAHQQHLDRRAHFNYVDYQMALRSRNICDGTHKSQRRYRGRFVSERGTQTEIHLGVSLLAEMALRSALNSLTAGETSSTDASLSDQALHALIANARYMQAHGLSALPHLNDAMMSIAKTQAANPATNGGETQEAHAVMALVKRLSTAEPHMECDRLQQSGVEHLGMHAAGEQAADRNVLEGQHPGMQDAWERDFAGGRGRREEAAHGASERGELGMNAGGEQGAAWKVADEQQAQGVDVHAQRQPSQPPQQSTTERHMSPQKQTVPIVIQQALNEVHSDPTQQGLAVPGGFSRLQAPEQRVPRSTSAATLHGSGNAGGQMVSTAETSGDKVGQQLRDVSDAQTTCHQAFEAAKHLLLSATWDDKVCCND